MNRLIATPRGAEVAALAADDGGDEVVGVVEVAEHRAGRQAGPFCDLVDGGGGAALADQVEGGLHDRVAVPLATEAAPVDRRLLDRLPAVVVRLVLVRLPDAHLGLQRIAGLTRGQWFSAAMVAVGVVFLFIIHRRKQPPLGGWARPATKS